MVDNTKTSRYRKAMMKAIKKAAQETIMFKASSLTNGLRVIKKFEQINKTKFNPFDEYHVELVTGNGCHEAIFRRLKLLRNEWAQLK